MIDEILDNIRDSNALADIDANIEMGEYSSGLSILTSESVYSGSLCQHDSYLGNSLDMDNTCSMTAENHLIDSDLLDGLQVQGFQDSDVFENTFDNAESGIIIPQESLYDGVSNPTIDIDILQSDTKSNIDSQSVDIDDFSITPSADYLDEFMTPEEPYTSDEHIQTAVHNGTPQISFKGYQEDARDAAASNLQSKLSDNHIYYNGNLYSSDTMGGWDRFTGEKIRHAIQDARNSGRITDAKYTELMNDLKNACYFES